MKLRCKLVEAAAVAAAAMTIAMATSAQSAERLPDDIAKYKYVGSLVVTDKKRPRFGFHHFFLNRKGLRAFRQHGPYPPGTIFVNKVYAIEFLRGQINEGDLQAISIMRKDPAARKTGGWRFAVFAPDGKPIRIDAKKACFECHRKARATDYIFSRRLN